MTIKEFFSFRRNRFFWFNIVAMGGVMCGFFFGVMRWLDIYTHHGEAVVVPDVKGMSVREAETVFANRGLVCMVADSTYRKDLTPGCVLDNKPTAGQKVKEGRIVYLTINTYSIPPKNVPDVADNSSLRQAEARLLAAGFKLAAIDTVRGELDWVYGVRYGDRLLEQGEEVPTGAALVLVVGDGSGELPHNREDSLAVDSLSIAKPVEVSKRRQQDDTEEESWF